MIEKFFLIPLQIEGLVNILLLILSLSMVVFSSIKIQLVESFFEEIVINSSIFSNFIAFSYLLMDAPDVAMTEVAISSCITTVVLLNILRILQRESKQKVTSEPKINTKKTISLSICIILIFVLSWASQDLPKYGGVDSPSNTHLGKYFIENTKTDIGIPSIVAAVLAGYRGFDTLGETVVILVAGISILLLLSRNNKTQ